MPRKIEIIHSISSTYKVEDSLNEGYLAFAYPGKFVGFGPTMEEALHMAKMRYRNAKKRFEDSQSDKNWTTFAKDREPKINAAFEEWGIKPESTWSEDNVDKT